MKRPVRFFLFFFAEILIIIIGLALVIGLDRMFGESLFVLVCCALVGSLILFAWVWSEEPDK